MSDYDDNQRVLNYLPVKIDLKKWTFHCAINSVRICAVVNLSENICVKDRGEKCFDET
jgi:hypothetical protein